MLQVVRQCIVVYKFGSYANRRQRTAPCVDDQPESDNHTGCLQAVPCLSLGERVRGMGVEGRAGGEDEG